MDIGMFRHLGPATEKARWPKQVFDFRTFRSPLTSDRRRAPAHDKEKISYPIKNKSLIKPSRGSEFLQTSSDYNSTVIDCLFGSV